MSPKQVRIETDTTYRSETPLRQKKFPNRRRTVRPSGIGTPAPLRQQSTLTQQPHWPVSRSSPNAEFEDEIQDQDGDYEDEIERSRPRRKKRKSEGDGMRQTRMSQFVPSSFVGERYDGAADHLLGLDEPDSFDGVRDSQSQPVLDEHTEALESKVQAFDDDSAHAAPDSDAEMQHDEEEHSQSTQHSSQDEERIDSVFAKHHARQRPSPELSVSAMTLRTPRRKFMSEIPSSNTPQSAIISICSAKSMRSPERSPLRNKSINAWSQNHAVVEDVRMSPVPESPTKPISPFRLSPVKNRPTFRVPEKPPTLQHRSTIPDSEDTATQVTPIKQKKFRSQIPDTQMDSFGEEITAVTETQLPANNYTQYLGGTYYAENDDYDYNFDPVGSALDRDAARFMQTQLLRDRIGYNAFHKTRSFSQDDEQQEGNKAEHKQAEGHEDTNLANVQQSQELGDELPITNSRPEQLEQEYEDPPTQSPGSSPQQPPRKPYESDEIEEIDLSGDIILPKTSVREVIQIASSPNSKSVSSGKYPSSPPLIVQNDARLRAEAAAQEQRNNAKNNTELHSSPLLPIILPIPPSQISTVGGTQLFHSLKRSTQKAACLSSSPPPLPPSTSSPPFEAKQRFRRFLDMYDSDDEDEMDKDEPELPGYGEEDDGMDLDFAPQRPHDIDRTVENDYEDESEDGGGYSRLRDILPDTLFDFSLPPPPTQSSARSSRF
jgi:hypothetical protein